ncbi:hypothetical protein LTR99_008618 [Exophiala xenobiotica]|uniref:Zn(2)-C6 fungal-type domain-containing protein n=1 Tax=Vermiconidia calcicola TaxID=1690605 RepID=A0AAV9Q0W7_9PEZI|nr:hypothetical protein LTR47_008061 [Exophiala xenobiotica]KAK5533007.1 hypothetical protein LTR25_007712 [Vermiconidia calcicola]KAK5534340.1 hypothetical protein LTR23_008769 [Chaetothyriales sp. CCFEE 6169]KAK5253089.1 hypothetical protein LTS06_002548 [Exophiala xenobiotica]KAK5269920.1 hypothetical protein LTR96_004419 [Exophiala xenobiotica]
MEDQHFSSPRLLAGDNSEKPNFDTAADGRIEMAQEDIDAIIRNKRKVRDPKACYACHRRKVKCDRNLPCDSCIKRDHPELCSYERPTKKRRIALPGAMGQHEGTPFDGHDLALQTGPNVTVPREQWERLNRELQRLRTQVKSESLSPGGPHTETDDPNPAGTLSRSDETEREGIHAPSNQMGTMHLGSRSVLAYMMGLGRSQTTQDTARSLLEENILPKLGLDNESATYPFVDLWSTASSMQDVSGLCKAIPDDELCREFFVAYRDVAGTMYPVVPDAASFEDTLTFMLSNRARALRDHIELDTNKPYGVSLPWLSLVFAVFASGSQCADRPAKERELTSQVYICCSYQALRMSNFLTHPCLETIEASLIIGNVLSYNMNPGVAYIFLGMTLRMAFSIGLQINSNHFTEAEKWTRRRIWWALAWQDSHFAVSYDRPTSSVMCIPDIPYGKFSSPGDRSYAESMFAIIRLTQQIVRERLLHPRSYMTWDTIRKHTDEIASIVTQAAAHLRDRNQCYTMTQHLERLAFKLHSSYIISELCRPALKDPSFSSADGGIISTPTDSPGGRRNTSHGSSQSGLPTPVLDPTARAQYRRECVQALEGAVAAYVEIHNLSKFAARSWIGIQRAISAAFLLGTLPDTSQDPQRLTLLRDLERVIGQRTTEDPTFDLQPQDGPVTRRLSAPEPPPLADSPHWVRSMAKSLNALGKLNAALNGPKPAAAKYPFSSNTNGQAGSGNILLNIGSNSNPSQTQSKSLYPGVTNLKQEPYSPALGTSGILGVGTPGMGMGSGGMSMGPITPDSTGSSSDWNFNNLHERAAEYVQAPLWGDGGVGTYMG